MVGRGNGHGHGHGQGQFQNTLLHLQNTSFSYPTLFLQQYLLQNPGADLLSICKHWGEG